MPPFGENFKKNISLLAFSMGCIPSHLSSAIHLLQTPQVRSWSGKFIFLFLILINFCQLARPRKGLQRPFHWIKLYYWKEELNNWKSELYSGQNAIFFYINLYLYQIQWTLVYCVYRIFRISLYFLQYLVSADIRCILHAAVLYRACLHLAQVTKIQKYWGSCPAIISRQGK